MQTLKPIDAQQAKDFVIAAVLGISANPAFGGLLAADNTHLPAGAAVDFGIAAYKEFQARIDRSEDKAIREEG
jgi:hypothetical protein